MSKVHIKYFFFKCFNLNQIGQSGFPIHSPYISKVVVMMRLSFFPKKMKKEPPRLTAPVIFQIVSSMFFLFLSNLILIDSFELLTSYNDFFKFSPKYDPCLKNENLIW